MSKAIELAEQCGMVIEEGHVWLRSSDGAGDGPPTVAMLEQFFRRSQAMALRDAARVIENSNPQVAGKVQQWADELEAGK